MPASSWVARPSTDDEQEGVRRVAPGTRCARIPSSAFAGLGWLTTYPCWVTAATHLLSDIALGPRLNGGGEGGATKVSEREYWLFNKLP